MNFIALQATACVTYTWSLANWHEHEADVQRQLSRAAPLQLSAPGRGGGVGLVR